MKNKTRIYNRQELLDLVNKEHSCIILKHCNRKIELQAKYLRNVKSGIKEALDSSLNKFDYSLNGILLDYQNLSVLVDGLSGRIVGRFGEFLVTVSAEFFIFDPKIGSLLEGVVNVKSSTHVGCLVHKRFNAMILKPDVEDKWNCENIEIGDTIVFTIVDHVFSTNIPHIEGVLATDYIGKSSKNVKKKQKLSASQTQGLTQNGKFDNLDVLVEAYKKITNPDEVDSSISNVRKEEENDLAGILGNKSPKHKSKKRKIDTMDVITDNTDADESMFHVKKKKKSKSKEKSETILETEKPCESLSESSKPVENPASVFSEPVIPSIESEYIQTKPKKKKRDKEKELDGSDSTSEHKKKKKKDKKKDLEDVSTPLESVEKKKHSENIVVEESVPKSKKKKKREKDKSGKTGEQCELPPSQKPKLCIDAYSEFNMNPVDLVDHLMNVVPTDIFPSEITPVKGTSLEKLKSPKLGDVRKNETREKSRSPGKKKREGSVTEITCKSTVADAEVSQTKKGPSGESMKSPKHVKQLDKSLFSDSEESAQSPLKILSELGLVDVRSPQRKLGVTRKDEDGDYPITSTQVLSKKPNDNKKEGKPRKVKDPEENQSKKKTVGIKEGEDSVSSIIKSASNKKDKKESGNKAVTWESENVLSPSAESKTTLLQRFEKSLGDEEVQLVNDLVEKSKTSLVQKDVNQSKGSSTKKKSIGESLAAKQSSKKAEPETNKAENNGESLTQRFSLGIDDTQLNNPVKTSTPKTESSKSDKSREKVKKPKSKKVKEASENDDRASIINALLARAKESLGIGELF